MGLLDKVTNAARTMTKQAAQLERLGKEVVQTLNKPPKPAATSQSKGPQVKPAGDVFIPAPAKPTEKTSVDSATHVEPKSTLYVAGLSPTDIKQGEVGDCTFQASMAGLASSPGGRAYLKSLITENYGPDGKVQTYTVKLFKETAPGSGVWKPSYVTVAADRFFSGASTTTNLKGETEVWPRVLESAMLKLNGGVPTANMPTSYGTLTGKSAVDTPVETAGIGQRMIQDFKAGRVQTLSTTGKLTGPISDPKLFDAHCYRIADIRAMPMKQADGSMKTEMVVILQNPHGTDNPRPIAMSELHKYFGDYSVGDVP